MVHSFEVKTFMANADKAEVKSGVSGNGEMKRTRLRLRVSSKEYKEARKWGDTSTVSLL